MQSSMPVAHITLICLIEGDSSPFFVKPKEDDQIMRLKELIQEEARLGSVDAKDLLLWKVRMIMGQRHFN